VIVIRMLGAAVTASGVGACWLVLSTIVPEMLEAPLKPGAAPLAMRVPLQHTQRGFAEATNPNPLTLCEQAVYQVFFPFALPLVFALRGRAAAINMRFWPKLSPFDGSQIFQFGISVMIAVSFWAPLVAWAFARYQEKVGSPVMLQVLDVEMLVLITSVVFQRLAVATKYLYMPRQRYKRQMTVVVTGAELLDDQLLTGWGTLKDSMLRSEMEDAMRRLGLAEESAAFFRLPQRSIPALEKQLRCSVDDDAFVLGMCPTGRIDDAATLPMSSPAAAVAAIARSDNGGAPTTAHSDTGGRGVLSTAQRRESRASVRGSGVGASPSRAVYGGGDLHAQVQRRSNTAAAALTTATTAVPSASVGAGTDSPTWTDSDASSTDPLASGGPVGPPLGAAPPSQFVYVRASWLARMLLRRADLGARSMSLALQRVGAVLALLAGFLPMIVRLSYGLPAMGASATQQLALCLSLAITVFFTVVILSYMRTALVDYRRRTNSLKRLSKLCSPDFTAGRQLVLSARYGSAPGTTTVVNLMLPSRGRGESPTRLSGQVLQANPMVAPPSSGGRLEDDSAVELAPIAAQPLHRRQSDGRTSTTLPSPGSYSAALKPGRRRTLLPHDEAVLVTSLIPLDCPGNAISFLLTRRLLLHFGQRYFLRIQAYQSYALLLTVTIVLALLVSLLLDPSARKSLSGEAQAPLVFFGTVALYYSVVLGASVVYCLQYAANANRACDDHCAMLAARGLEQMQVAEAARLAGDVERAQAAQASIQTLEGVRNAIRSDLHMEPVRIVGIPASYGLLQAIMAGMLSLVTATGQLLFGKS
jgi:hypothetical protein